jgi:hypothetical protein
MYISKILRYVSAPLQLQQFRRNTNREATSWLYQESYLQGIHTKQITTYTRVQLGNGVDISGWLKLNCHLEMVYTVSGYMTILFHCYIQTRHISLDTDNFSNSAKATTKWPENQPNQRHLAEEVQ